MVSINIGASTALLSKKQSSTYYNTPAGVFCTRLVSAPAIYAELNTEVIFARLLASAPPICELGEALIRTATDGGGVNQKRVFFAHALYLLPLFMPS